MSENNIERTDLTELGEFGLIAHLTKNISVVNSSTIKGIGDDAAVINNQGILTLVSTDLLVEDVHFDLSYTPLRHLGYKAAVSNFSDILAMNGIPKQITVGIAVSNRFSVEALEEFYKGLNHACLNYNVDIVGGDTTSSQSGFFISITVIGEVKKEDVVYRNTAKENNLICVTGDLGASYVGLLLLKREKEVYLQNPEVQPDIEGNDYILERQLKPEARIDVIRQLKDMGVKPTSMIDISDGLASELYHICNDSEVGCDIYEEKIPIDPTTSMMAEEFEISPATCAFNGGEDYELLFTIDTEDYDKIKDIKQISVIGHITDKNSGIKLITPDGRDIEITAQGWNAFRK